MMTTEARSGTRAGALGPASPQTGVLTAVAVLAIVVAALLVGLGALVDGRDGALGALTGTGIGLFVFGFGCATLALVARLLPGATLLVALMTFGVQAALLLLLFVRLSGVPFYAEGPGRLWYGLGLLAVTVTWMMAQLLLTARALLAEGPLTDARTAAQTSARTAGRTAGRTAETGGEQ